MSTHHIFAVLICVLAFAGLFFLLPTAPHSPASQSTIDISKADLAALKDRTIVDFGTAVNGVVAYSYLAEPVPEKLAASEVPEMRTESSYTKFDGVVKDGTDPTLQLTSVIYSQPAYAQDVNGQWKYLEYATTTEQAFRERDVSLAQRIAEVFVRTAYADSISPFSGAGDGDALASAVDTEEVCFSQWSVATHDATDGTTVDSTGIVMSAYSYDDVVPFGCSSTIYRAFIPFTTTSLPTGAVVSSATLNVYATLKNQGANDGNDFITVVQTSQVASSTLALADFDAIGTTEGVDAGQRKDITGITLNSYVSFTLNTTGISWIKTATQSSNCSVYVGGTCFGLREGHDNLNSPSITTYTTFSTSEETGTSQDPYLSVTYTVPVSVAVKSGMKVSSNGSLKITSGGLKIK